MNHHADSLSITTIFDGLDACSLAALIWRQDHGAVAINNTTKTLLNLDDSTAHFSDRRLASFVHPDDRPRALQTFAAYVAANNPETLELPLTINSANDEPKRVAVTACLCTRKSAAEKEVLLIVRELSSSIVSTSGPHKSDLERLILKISLDTIRAPVSETDTVITEALGAASAFIGADRAYRFDYDWDKQLTHNTHEWCGEGITPQLESLQNIPTQHLHLWTDMHQKGLPYVAASVLSRPKDDELRQILEPQGILSLATIPIMTADKCTGFIGFDSVRNQRFYTDIEISLLELLAELISNAQLKKRREQSLIDLLTESRKASVKALEMEKEATLANQAKSTFVATMSHEIRTPLHVLLGMMESLNDTQLDREQQQILDTMRSSGNNLSGLIGDILDFSKIEQNAVSVNISEFELNKVSHELVAQMAPLAEAKGISLDLSLPDESYFVSTDQRKVIQIASNLMSNAIKFTHRGSVDLACCINPVDQDSESKNFELQIKVRDTGIGISPQNVSRLREPFFQVSSSDVTQDTGTGLGIPIVSGLLESLNGRLDISSKPGKGSTFTATIPVSAQLVAKTKTEDVSESQTPPGDRVAKANSIPTTKVLVAEDNTMNQMLLRRYLDSNAIALDVVSNGADAVEMAIGGDYDLILMDCRMPVMGGLEATRRIRRALTPERNAALNIIAVTASSVKGDEDDCLAAGMNALLKKPFSRAELWRTLGQCISVDEQ
ncbi:hybrid sensor histidine kinase/response regulator [Congregibacter sp.]|uniref:hybrid sensor histidine kinase/response regulator n=1 Tax=Congregibacter sp. TaxID=2744308 RepID=UPI003F6BC21C